MKIVVGSDHRGFKLKEYVKRKLEDRGFEVIDVGTNSVRSVDYPDFAVKACREIQQGNAERGILICGTGIGMSITANKMRGIRAALVFNESMAEMSSRHNDANVICLSASLTSEALASRLIDVWIDTPFEGGRHKRRIEKIRKIEKEGC